MSKTTNLVKYTNKNPLTNYFTRNFLKVLVKETKKLRPETILDVGCGEGFTMWRLKQEKIGKHIEGIEYDDKAISLGKQLHPFLEINKGTIYNLPYRSNSFDMVICSEVLEHLEYPDKAMQELVRVSKKHFIISVPNEPWFTFQRLLRGKNILELGDHPEHLHKWTSKKFKKFISSFVTIKTIYHPLPWTLVIAKKK